MGYAFLVVTFLKRGLDSLFLVFSVTPFKIDQTKKSKPFNRLSPESGKREKVNMRRLSKIQVTAFFRKQDMRRKFLLRYIEICMETPCW